MTIKAFALVFSLASYSLPACSMQPNQAEVSGNSIKSDPFAAVTPDFRLINLEYRRFLNKSYSECGASPSSPIVLNIHKEPFEFSDENDTVPFDIDRDGIKENLGWTLRGANTAFLALDRNDNGSIDDGSELFTSHSPQPESPCANGYLALQELDKNGDGMVSASDEAFHDLLLWTDSNHNGISEKSELTPASLHLRSIYLAYTRSDRQDRAGNTLSLFGVSTTKSHKDIMMVDVRFLEISRSGS